MCTDTWDVGFANGGGRGACSSLTVVSTHPRIHTHNRRHTEQDLGAAEEDLEGEGNALEEEGADALSGLPPPNRVGGGMGSGGRMGGEGGAGGLATRTDEEDFPVRWFICWVIDFGSAPASGPLCLCNLPGAHTHAHAR